ncbi:FGGY-family carbohydrate kinase [Pararhizobium antarcticum]|uniref:Sugar kinase n=1 Tax=Pararhizobium antarcticum TaxID=1798805 RepID=A0A657LT25_9HYPH|nr:FGGY-family carbohydrate kinase [Pararhizobium antarcticum]OJF97662.1 sugar kinase [Pararhizobium antarcticum]OJF99875.1 sugar kinase [Rhizobium sp. 58]
MTFLLGLDFGTGGVRVGVFDLENRRMLGENEEAYETVYPRPGWAEQSPLDWWNALGRACRALMQTLDRPEIAGICVATTASTVVACKRDGTPLRPALLWMDCRAAGEAERSSTSNNPVMDYVGGANASEWLISKAMWLAVHERQVYDDADIVCECLDYINYNLTGRWVGSRMNATCKWNYDSVQQRFPAELYAELGVEGLEDKLPPEIFAVGAPIERISENAQTHLGLSGRPVLSQGGIDAHIGMLGAGTIKPGEMLMIGGTSVVQLFQLKEQRPMQGFWGPYPHALIDDHWLVEAGQVSAGSVLTWFEKNLFELDADGRQALRDKAAAIPVGGTGLLTLDYFMGNRTPYREPLLRGAIIGLSLGHDRASMYRSAIEGVALASANVLKRVHELNVPVERIVSSGGYAKNRLWLQATVDAIGMPVELPKEANLTIIGAAAAAAAGSGLVADLFAAAEAVRQDTVVIEPDMAAHAIYQQLLGEYIEATELLMPQSRRLATGQLKG